MSPASCQPPARRVFVGGRVLTMDPDRPQAEAVVFAGDRITATGNRSLPQAYPDAEVRELHGRILLPGFIDAHNHLSLAALHPIWADLSQVSNLEELRQALQGQAARETEAQWIRGAGWNESKSGLVPDRHQLDALGFDRPVIIAHYTLHQCVVDSRGLDVLGIGRATADPPGGTIARGADGEPTGLLIERAWSAAHARSLAAYRDPDRWRELIAARARVLLRDGITCVHDAACSPLAEEVYRSLAAAKALPISVLMMPHPEAILSPPAAERLDGPLTGDGDEWARVGPIKLFADGGVAPAIDLSSGGERITFGIRFADLSATLMRAVSAGFRVAVHALGNAGVQGALEAFAGAARAQPAADHRFRIEHAALASPEQIRIMAELGAVAVVQPGFLRHMGEAVEHFDFEGATWMPFGDMVRGGVTLAASSDDPCAFYAPLQTSACGTTRVTGSGGSFKPEQAVDYASWLRAYTAGAAYAGGQEHERGSITPGKRADFVVVEGDLNARHPPRVVETWVAGTLAYAAG